ncbi:L-alanine-DL-glutamate epimerase fmaily protein [Candidatus Koribacter versatilis Ellin345]|uniref:Dipeptide epimerase n=1 Tax=Koribacter versatilis (strain Ellin345) TaxID=204669 RepID=Q1IJ94_KORVE|nr:dipeptide epimerase [Candidatus Koribacter versatilis]ABF43056.1 L-alanine-DL-glutamate epimerase fmaily protein [Candidatus Koribacter versatilis Ellin345]
MNRRELLQLSTAAGAALLLSNSALAQASQSTDGHWHTSVERLKLRHTWTTTMSSSEYRDTLHARFTSDGVVGYGEGAPIVRYREDAATGQKALESQMAFLNAVDPWHFEKVMAELAQKMEGNFAAKAAIDIALMDWAGKRLNAPIYRMLGLDAADAPVTTFSIGIDTPEITRQKVREAEEFPVLKIKVGLKTDEATVEAVRSVTKKPLRVDANEGWTDKEEAVRKINWLESQGVEFVEQPMPAHMIEETRWVRSKVHLPILADEAAVNAHAIPGLMNAYDGINVKLDKCGGIQQSLKMINVAKALGMKTMLGCMVSTSVSVTAAAHLSPLVDYADLDGNLLIANDPFTGVKVEKGKLVLPNGPGLGLTKNS